MSDIRKRALVGTATLAALLLLATACGGEETNGDGGVDNGGIPGATGESAEEPGPGSLYGGGMGQETTGATGGGASGEVSVSLNNYLFDPSEVEVASGAVVEVTNANTRTPHTFTVVGEDVDLQLGPQESGTVTIDLAPGTYDLVCTFHEQLGMTGTLTVT